MGHLKIEEKVFGINFNGITTKRKKPFPNGMEKSFSLANAVKPAS